MPDKLNSFPFFAREGWPHIAITLGLATAVQIAAGTAWAMPFWILSIFVLQFFRDPPRTIPGGPDDVICPAHGKVVFAGTSDDPMLDRKAYKISIFMNVFSAHSNFSPVSGEIRKIEYHKGKYLNAALDKASYQNERNIVHVKTDAGEDVVFVQIAGLVARRILCHVHEGQRIVRGQRYGFIRFGSRVDVFLPETATPLVSIGDSVMSGNDIIANLAAADQAES